MGFDEHEEDEDEDVQDPVDDVHFNGEPDGVRLVLSGQEVAHGRTTNARSPFLQGQSALPQEPSLNETAFRLDSRHLDLRRPAPDTPAENVSEDGFEEVEDEDEMAGDEIQYEPEEPAPAKRKRGRRKERFITMNPDELVESVSSLLSRIEGAARKDMESNEQKRPAIEKLKMLDEVEEACIHREKQPLLMNGGAVLKALKMWLEPLPDGTLPNIKIRTTVLRILQKLPIDTADQIVRQNLKMSEIGSRVMFLSRIKDEIPKNKRMASELVQRWSRPIFEEALRDDEEERNQYALTARKRRMEAERVEEEKRKILKPGDPDFKYVASRPQPNWDYVIKPASRVNATGVVGQKKSTVVQKINRIQRNRTHPRI